MLARPMAAYLPEGAKSGTRLPNSRSKRAKVPPGPVARGPVVSQRQARLPGAIEAVAGLDPGGARLDALARCLGCEASPDRAELHIGFGVEVEAAARGVGHEPCAQAVQLPVARRAAGPVILVEADIGDARLERAEGPADAQVDAPDLLVEPFPVERGAIGLDRVRLVRPALLGQGPQRLGLQVRHFGFHLHTRESIGGVSEIRAVDKPQAAKAGHHPASRQLQATSRAQQIAGIEPGLQHDRLQCVHIIGADRASGPVAIGARIAHVRAQRQRAVAIIEAQRGSQRDDPVPTGETRPDLTADPLEAGALAARQCELARGTRARRRQQGEQDDGAQSDPPDG